MTLVTGTAEDIGLTPDNSLWMFSSPLRESSDGEGLITPKWARRYPVDGIISIELDPGPAVINYRGIEYQIEVPESGTAKLKDLIAAEIAFPTGTPPQLVGNAVDAYLDVHPLDWNVLNKPAVIAAGATPALARQAVGATTTGSGLFTATDAAAARNVIGAPNKADLHVNVKDYGALGNNGTNDTAAVQAAIDAAAAVRSTWASTRYQQITVWFPNGRYSTAAITLGDGIKLDGAGAILQPIAGFTGTMITMAGQYAHLAEGLMIRGLAANGEQAVVVNGGKYHNHISSTFQNWGGIAITDLAGGTRIDSHFVEGMRNTEYVNSLPAGTYVGVINLNGTDAGYIIGTEINASRYTYPGTSSLGPSTNGVVAALVCGGSNALVYGIVAENADVGVVNYSGPQGGKWNAFIGCRSEFNFLHDWLFLGGSGRVDSCRAMGGSRGADNTGDGFHFEAGSWIFSGSHSTSEFPADGKTHRYGCYKGSTATLLRSTFMSTGAHSAFYDAATSTAYSTVPSQDPNVSNINGIDGQKVIGILSNATAVNYLQIQNRAAGAPAIIAALGDTNQDIGFQPRGTGGLYVYSPTGTAIPLKAQGAGTNVGWNLTTKGTGQVQINGVRAATANDVAGLTDIAALTPSNDDMLQRKSGAWTNRTPAQVKADLALTPAEVGSLSLPKGYASANWYSCGPNGALTTGIPVINRIWYQPWNVMSAVTIAELQAEITAAGSADSLLRLGFYLDNGSGKPGALIAEAGTISTGTGNAGTVSFTAAGMYSIPSLAITIPAGLIWVASKAEGTTGGTVRVPTSSAPIPQNMSFGTTTPVSAQQTGVWIQGTTAGALPATAGATATTNPGGARLLFKAA